MKKIITFLVAILVSTATFAQKNELKAADKALDTNNYTEALSNLKSIESTIGAAKDKYKTQYYFLLGKTLYANGTTPDTFIEAGSAFNTLFELEKLGSIKYTDDATAIVNTMVKKVADGASNDYNKAIKLNKDPNTKAESISLFDNAAKGFEKVYTLSKLDTAFIQNSALAYFFSENYTQSVANYKKLLDIGYTGISTTYIAESVVNGSQVAYNSKKEMDNQVKMKLVINPKVDVRESQRNSIIKMIAKNYIALEDNENALTAIKEAQKLSPEDYSLLVDEANVYYAMGDNPKFKEKLEEAVKINPSDPVLYYNIGVMKMELKDVEGAVASFTKAIDINPNYTDAYNNIGAVILTKAEPIVEEMNNNLSDFKKYDMLQAKQYDVFREALPYLEKTFELDNTRIDVVQNLLVIYENLEMYEKQKEMQAVYNKLKE